MPQALRNPARWRTRSPHLDHGEPIRAIDTRPMLFVALFIAVAFLLAASQTRQHALLVELPQPERGLLGTPLSPIVLRISITASGELQFNGVALDEDQFKTLLHDARSLEPRPFLVFEPDGEASYDRSAKVLGMIYRAGLVDERFCIDGMERHGAFDRSRGHPLPLITSIWMDEAKGAQPMVLAPDIDTCAPELFGTTGR